ncbi:MAG: hypothetical protein ACRD5R_00075 [Candidatus Acidiferrales bacterium]
MVTERRTLRKRFLGLLDTKLGDRVGVFLVGALLLILVLLAITFLSPWFLIETGHGKLWANTIQYTALIVIFVPGRYRWGKKLRDADHEWSSYVAGTLVGSFAAGIFYDAFKVALGSEHGVMTACVLVLLAVQRVIIIAMRHERLSGL